MLRGIYGNSASMQIMQNKMDVLANNLANSTTAGFKKKNVFLQQLISAEQAVERNKIPVMLTKEKIATYTDPSNGKLKTTGNPLDVAIQGDGFFEVQTENGTAFTRNGEFKISNNGILVNSEGYPIVGEGGPIEVNGSSIEINSEGMIIIDGKMVNKLSLKQINMNHASSEANGLYFTDEANDIDNGKFSIVQGSIELSNVDIVKEMVNMIATQRHYDINSKVIKAQDDTLNKSVNQVGRV